MTQMTLLHPGDPFPTLTVALPEGRALRLPDALAGHYGVVLFYRGSWCPYCNAQLRAFQRSLDRFADMDTPVIALSVDDETTTRYLREAAPASRSSQAARTQPPGRLPPRPSPHLSARWA